MYHHEYLTVEELANIFCMESDELETFLESRDFNIELKSKYGEPTFSYEEVQKHLQSQYFI